MFTPLENAPRLAAGSSGLIRARDSMPHASSLTGFTIVELVVVIALMAMLATATAVSYQAISRRLRLTAEVQQLTTTLQAARDQTISSKGRTAYGVHFETNRYTLFALRLK